MRCVVRLFTKTSLALALSLGLSACQSPFLSSQQPAVTRPAEPPPPIAAPKPPAVHLEPAAESFGPRPVRAALLVPLSGSNAALGEHLFNAAQLALFDLASERFALQPFDTQGTAQGAAAAAQQALAQGANIVLGPIFSAEVKAAGDVTRAAGVPMVAFTTDATAAGNGTFILGVLPRSQVARVVAHARLQGLTRFAMLAPDNTYGHAVAQAYQQVVTDGGGQVTRLEFYDPNSRDGGDAVRRLGGTGGPAFEALLLPDEGMRLRGVATQLPMHGMGRDKVQLLGTMLWSDPRLGGEPALVGGWFPAPPPAERQQFVAAYEQNFGTRPPAIASLAYDATALAAVLAQKPNPNFDAMVLTAPSGFAGVDGIFRLLPDGTNQRGLAVMEVTPAGPSQISPAPTSFDAPVF